MPAEGHRPIRNTDQLPRHESSLEGLAAPPSRLEAAPSRPKEPVVLPYYQPPRRRPRPTGLESMEAFAPGDAPLAPLRDAAEASFGDTQILEAVIGQDDRVKVADPLMSTNPWRQVCALRIRAKTGTIYVGTGWFIGPLVLATAGHCVFMQKEGGWPEAVDVIPGKHGQTEPFGRITSHRFATVDGWIEGTAARDFDYGVIFLDDPTVGTKLGNFEVDAALDGELVGITARISGYPADRDQAEFQYYHERPLESVTRTRLLYDIDTYGGQSGSPIWQQLEGSPAVAIGVHTTGGLTSNSGTRISEPVLDNFILWNEEP